MGYYLQAFIGRPKDIDIIKRVYNLAAIVPLKYNLALIHLEEELFNQISEDVNSEPVKGFEYLFTSIETNILQIIGDLTIGYVEAFYWGGEGKQSAIIWETGKRKEEIISTDNAINHVLNFFGVLPDKGKDEFDTLDFGILESDRSWDGH